MERQAGKHIAFGWYGGKYSHLDWLLPLLPATTHFCDVFGGSAAVLINREPSPVETYNDIDSEVVTLFRVQERAEILWMNYEPPKIAASDRCRLEQIHGRI